MDDEGEEGDHPISSTRSNIERRITTKTSLKEIKSDERTMTVLIQESLDGSVKRSEDYKSR